MSEIEVDLSVLKEKESIIRLSDLKVQDTIKLLGNLDETIVSVVLAKEVGQDDDNSAPILENKEEEKKE